jgi:plastocyanin
VIRGSSRVVRLLETEYNFEKRRQQMNMKKHLALACMALELKNSAFNHQPSKIMKPQHTTTSFAPRIANWVAILLSMAAVPATATTIADIAGDYTGPSALPAGWSYLYSSQASGGTEVALTPDLALGNGGNSGFGRVAPGIYNLPGVIGTQTGAQYEMFGDGDLNAPALGSDLLIHPGPDAANNTVILRYTISADEIAAHGNSASIAGSFRELISGGNSVTVSVYHNATLLFAKTGSGGTLTQANGTFNISCMTVAAGDTISFAVNSNADLSADETALRGTIALVVTAPPVAVTIIADVAADYAGPSTLPVGWSYLYSSQASGGTEVALTPDLALGNGGNSGFGRPAPGIYNLPGVIGTQTGTQYEIFGDGDRNAPELGTDLLLHPGPDAANNTVIIRYTISAAAIASYGNSASIAGSFRELLSNNGDSVTVSVYHNATQLFAKTGSADILTQANGTFDISGVTVAAGDTISFAVNANANLYADETALRGTIALVKSTGGTLISFF